MKREFVRLYCVLSVLCCVCLSGVLWADVPIRIMPMGDSVTSGVYALGIPEEADMISYRYELYNMLNTVGYDFDFIGSRVYGDNIFSDAENASVPGISSYQMAHMIRTGWNQKISVWETPGPYFDTYPTDIVLLLIGIAGFNDGPEGVVDVLDAIDESSEDIVVILGLIPNVMCCSEIPPCDRCVDVPIFNDELESLALARIADGDQIIIVDMETGAGLDYREQPVGDMYNNAHPVRSGYDKMAPVWYDALKTVLPEMGLFEPQFTTDAVTQMDADTVYKYYSYAVGNPDPCYALLEGPAGMTFAPYPYGPAMLLQWTPTIADLGPHSVTIAASNSEGVALQSFDLYVTPQPVIDIEAGLIAHWKLDETSGTIAYDSVGSNNGTFVGSPTWIAGAPEGLNPTGAADFDCTSSTDARYIDCGDGAALDITGDRSLAAWFRIDNWNAEWTGLVTKGANDGSYNLIRSKYDAVYGGSNDGIAFQVKGMDGSPSSQQVVRGEINVTDGQWHHAVGTY
ncbi:MAG: hypothetical protein KAJ46_02010, partial [Sedimentisphaerales bacterium]|nr:hypothetical protein [Sedimentisphaerales bacterium]